MKKRLLILTFMLLLAGNACGGRIPTNAKASSVAKKHFQKYGKKYKETDLGQSRVATVEVKAVEELQKNVATGFLLVKLDNGTEIPVVMTFQRKLPLGWRTIGWERATP